MQTFFTADWHLGHFNILKSCNRPFRDVEEMHNTLHRNWNEVVEAQDQVYVLGDVTLGKVEQWAWFIQSLNGKKILVAGNHDACWSKHRRKARAERTISNYHEAGFDVVFPTGEVRIHVTHNDERNLRYATKVLLSHLPYTGDSQEDSRYAERRPVDAGLINICGHVHNNWIRQGRSVNVGVDVRDFTPVHENELSIEIERIKEFERA